MPLVRTHKRHAVKVRKPVWFRLVALDHYRGGVDDSAYRLAIHLSQWAHLSGNIPDMGDVIDAYQAFHGVSRRTAWNDVKRLGIHGAGYLRQAEAPAPGRTATYQLCLPESLPQGLPDDLMDELRHVLARPRTYTVTATIRTDADPARAVAQTETVTRVTSSRVEAAEDLAELTMYAKGGVFTASEDVESGTFPTWLHTSQFSRGCSTPTHRNGQDRRSQRPTLGGKHSLDDMVTSVLSRCAPRWQSQRGAARGLDEAAAARLRPLLRGALMYQTSADVISVITEAVASARDLGAVIAARLRKLIIAGRRILHLDTVKADDQGKYYETIVAEKAKLSSETMSSPRTRRAIEDLRATLSATRTTPVGLAERAAPALSPDRGFTEAPEAFTAELAAAGIPTTAAAWQQAEEDAAREAAHRAALTYARTGQPVTPQGIGLDEAAASMWSEGDPAF